jgi:putative ABC transport system substrate-binding protein
MGADIPLPRRALSVEDYHRMGEVGLFAPEEQLELIHGNLVTRAPIGEPQPDIVLLRPDCWGRARIATAWRENPAVGPDSRRPGQRVSTTRRILVALLVALAPPAGAQAPGRVAWISSSHANVVEPCVSAFKEGMREQGMVEGKRYVLAQTFAEGHYDRFPALTKEALLRNPAVLVGQTIASIRAMQQATKSVPILFVGVNDPVGSGLVGNLARPEGNTTGLSNQSEDLLAKYVEFLREILPRAKRVAIVFNTANGSHPKMLEQVRASTTGFGIATQSFGANSPGDLDATFGAVAKYRPDALLLVRDAMFVGERERIAALALEQRLPTFVGDARLVRAGGLFSYAASTLVTCHRAASYVKRILEGAKPADVPVEQPTTFELAINLRTAKALGLTIPRSLLVRADVVIQ